MNHSKNLTHAVFGYVNAETKAHALHDIVQRLFKHETLFEFVHYGAEHDKQYTKDENHPCLLMALSRLGTTLFQWLMYSMEESDEPIRVARITYMYSRGLKCI